MGAQTGPTEMMIIIITIREISIYLLGTLWDWIGGESQFCPAARDGKEVGGQFIYEPSLLWMMLAAILVCVFIIC